MPENLQDLAHRYFEYLAQRFPVMCASDEFLAMPRAQAASRYYHKLDDLDAEVVGECLAVLKAFRNDFQHTTETGSDLESCIDLQLLKANTTGVLLELEENQSWRHNPLLYLKIAFIGLDHALTKPAADEQAQRERTLARLQSIPRLLRQGMANIEAAPISYLQAASAMVADCRGYLAEISEDPILLNSQHAGVSIRQVQSTLGDFGSFLAAIVPVPDESLSVAGVAQNLQNVLLSSRSLADIFQIAVEEWQLNLEQIQKLGRRIQSRKSWQQLYHDYCPVGVRELDTFSLYGREVERLTHFFRTHDFGWLTTQTPLVLCETPTYLRSVRSSASFSAASGAHPGEPDRFYLSTRLPPRRGRQAEERLRARLHREYQFLTAHETYPGHQLLDTMRRHLANPVRRQIESPLFYEGWAYYAESLLAECGYVDRPIDLLVDCKRRLWRAARCQIDVGLTTAMLKPADAIELLTAAGFSSEEAKTQVNRFRLNPGYQLCYSLGRYEIMELRKAFAPRLGRGRFHRELLEGGQLPFHLAEQRLNNIEPIETTQGA
ncbi:MAG TPA: hypothetical protein DCE18_11900 [Syntrophobacteraceae bacterium]|nr:hypothetical protein [Syntrophobacteraceae bacterium]